MTDPHRHAATRGLKTLVVLGVPMAIVALILLILGITSAIDGDTFRAAWRIVGGIVLAAGVIVMNHQRRKRGMASTPTDLR